jgi:hypothetical protein
VAGKRYRLGIPPFNPPPHDQYRRFPWQPEELALLGKVSDGELASTLGLATATVNRKRQELDIPPLQPALRPIEWTPAMIERLGKASDARVADELGISVNSVARKRQALGIPATMENHPVERNEDVAELLRLPSAEVQRRTGMKWETIQRLRRELGVQEPILAPKEVLAAQAGVDPSAPHEPAGHSETPVVSAAPLRSSCRWTPEELALLGSAPDREIAARFGRTVGAVKRQRAVLGLVRRLQRRWQPHEVELLGTAPDSEIAGHLGRSVGAVRRKRLKLGIRYRQPATSGQLRRHRRGS